MIKKVTICTLRLILRGRIQIVTIFYHTILFVFLVFSLFWVSIFSLQIFLLDIEINVQNFRHDVRAVKHLNAATVKMFKKLMLIPSWRPPVCHDTYR